ncbi:ATP-binding cassette domain-containing protein [Varibaculum cambriense]|uniref:ABC transporter ATP-binding protein/permease n=1 Tax=Varibaculum cambriense TaxID=184870 RepID=UPI002912BEC8|nr:ATP-binding cassette domain-containing protein [Varibaculum cambriense]MDU5541513.1 ATP-binding cassette domain-containing protein [Varibaculum cambriense]
MAKKLSLSRPAGTVAIIASVILTLISVVLAAGFIVLLGYALSHAFSGKSLSGILGGLIFAAVVLGGCEATRISIEQHSIYKEQQALQSRLLLDFFRQGSGVLASRSAGSLIDMMTSGTEKIQRYRQAFLGSMIGAMVSPLLVLTIMALFVDPWCALVLLGFVPLVPAIIFGFSKLTRKVSSSSRRRRNQLAASYLDALSGLETLTLLGAADLKGQQLAQVGEENRLSTMRLLAANQLILLVIDLGFNLLLLTVGFALTLWKVINGAWGSDITVIAPVVSMVGLTLLLLEPMNKIGSFFYVGMAGMANQRLVRAFLSGKAPSRGQDGDASSDKAQVVAHSDTFLSLQDLTFAYPEGDPVLQSLDLEIKPGEWVAICGPSGAGKSTLIEILKGNLLPSQGAYYLQGRALDANSSAWFADQSALVQQHTWIFTGTIRSNLMMVAPRASEERLWECLEKVGLAAEVRAFAQGLDTPVGEDGYALSGGQAQRLSLARALLSERELLLLDEATSQIDLESEAAITQALAEVAKEKTIVLLTHRASALEFADRVLYLQDGALKEVVR